MVDQVASTLLQPSWRETVSKSDHEQLGKRSAAGNKTMQLDALPDELLDGIVGEDAGYQLADEGPKAPPPLPPGGSPAATAAEGGSNKTMLIAVVVAVLMAVAGVVVGTIVLGEDDAPAEPPPSIELGDIEVQAH